MKLKKETKRFGRRIEKALNKAAALIKNGEGGEALCVLDKARKETEAFAAELKAIDKKKRRAAEYIEGAVVAPAAAVVNGMMAEAVLAHDP